MGKALDEIVEKDSRALVLSSSDEKIWSNGMNLTWIGDHGTEGGIECVQSM